MRSTTRMLVLAGTFAIVSGAGGYWIGRRAESPPTIAPASAAQATAPLYYQDPTGAPYYAAAPRKDANGNDYVPVYVDPDVASAAPPASAPATDGGPTARAEILYYRNPMGLPDKSPVPKKDSMGMDYIPVYADEAGDAGTVRISPDKVQKLGVRTETVEERRMVHVVRAVGTVAADERRLSVVNAKFDGWIEKLYVGTTGQAVKRGEPMAEVYSPDLVLAQQEYLIARPAPDRGQGGDASVQASSKALADAALQHLRNWDLSPDQVMRSGKVTRTLTLRAPMAGQVLDKPAVVGMHFAPGDTLFKLADLSTIWVMAEIFEQDLGLIQLGADAKISIKAYPGRSFTGQVDFIYPMVSPETRTAKIRIQVPNGDGLLKTDMYATVELASPMASTPTVAVPESAVLDTGARQVVLIERGEGRYEPRTVKLGAHADGYVIVESGVSAGDKVVVGANFLIDAESNLRAALQGFTAPAQGSKTP
jgi:Cu(I)/Ag(I) efflux system membrane fusion protein